MFKLYYIFIGRSLKEKEVTLLLRLKSLRLSKATVCNFVIFRRTMSKDVVAR